MQKALHQKGATPEFLLCSKRQQCDIARPLDCHGHLALMLCTVAGNATGQDLAALRRETAKLCNILVINMLNLVYAKRADLPARPPASVTSYQDSPLLSKWDLILRDGRSKGI